MANGPESISEPRGAIQHLKPLVNSLQRIEHGYLNEGRLVESAAKQALTLTYREPAGARERAAYRVSGAH
jgi:hypothetical protein